MALKTKPRLATDRDLAVAAESLAGQCRHMRQILKTVGVPTHRDFTSDFTGLAQIIVGQQLSAQSAAAIWGRIAAAIIPMDAPAILARSGAELAALGLSGGKIRTLKALSAAIEEGTLDLTRLNDQADVQIHEALTQLHGIGPWTADIYLLFALRRADAFAAGDLALQLAAQRIFKLAERPTAAALSELAERWRPWRGVAARLLWADYARVKSAPKAKKKPASKIKPSVAPNAPRRRPANS